VVGHAVAPGRVGVRASLSDLALAARTLGQFVAALHRPAPADAPENPWRVRRSLNAARASTSGDPATDVSVAWMLLPPPLRGEFRAVAGDSDDSTWARARAWALSLVLVYVALSHEHPRMVRIGRDVLDPVLADG